MTSLRRDAQQNSPTILIVAATLRNSSSLTGHAFSRLLSDGSYDCLRLKRSSAPNQPQSCNWGGSGHKAYYVQAPIATLASCILPKVLKGLRSFYWRLQRSFPDSPQLLKTCGPTRIFFGKSIISESASVGQQHWPKICCHTRSPNPSSFHVLLTNFGLLLMTQ